MEKLKPLKSFDECLNIALRDSRQLPDKLEAVYVIYVSPNIAVYIGMTTNLRNRCDTHRKTYGKVKDVRLAWFPLPREFHRITEKALIEAHQPLTNWQFKPSTALWIYWDDAGKINRHINRIRKEQAAA